MTTKLNKRERRAAALLAHYAACERLGRALGMSEPDGKRISLALLKIEREAHKVATAYCNGERVRYSFKGVSVGIFDPNAEPDSPTSWEAFAKQAKIAVAFVFNGGHENVPPAFFVNGDARGYALKIDNEQPEGKALIESVKLHTDWGGYGILSPEITGG